MHAAYNIANIAFIPTGRGAISGNQVSLSSSSFQSDPPTFTLLGATSGGPPTTYTWTRNGQVITNSASYSISIEAESTSGSRFQKSRYRSTLTVTGRLPGVYQYSVTNRATSGMVTDTFTIESKCIGLLYIHVWSPQLFLLAGPVEIPQLVFAIYLNWKPVEHPPPPPPPAPPPQQTDGPMGKAGLELQTL